MWLLILREMLGFLIMMLIGVIAAKCNFITRIGLASVNTLAQKVFLPIMIYSFTYQSLTIESLFRHWPMIPLTVCFYIAVIALTTFLSKALKLSVKKAGVFRMVFTFGNTGFIGLPLLSAAFAKSGVINLLLFMVVDQFVLWTYGIKEASRSNDKPSIAQSAKGLLNPNLIAFVLGFITIALGLRIPSFLEEPLDSLSAVASPLCMACIGCLCLYSSLSKALMQRELYVGIVLKMIAMPLVCLPFLSILPFNLEGSMIPCLLLMMAMPTTTLVPLVVAAEGGDQEYATRMTIATIIASIFTIPLLTAILGL